MDKKQFIQSVTGQVEIDRLGITLMHEHLLIDIIGLWHKPTQASRIALAKTPVCSEILGELRHDPFVNLDNLQMLDMEIAVSEVMKFKDQGGQTIVDVTSRYNGRDPLALRAISQRTGLNIIMGCGYYMEYSYPPELKKMSIESIVEEIIKEITEGVDESGIKAGIIGEAGVSKDMTDQEIKLLKAQSRAQAKTNVPLTIHTHGWGRQCNQILDIVEEEGANLQMIILDHMNPSLHDFEYQISLLERGVFLEYDMIGMDYYYPELDGQSPSDEENANAIKSLIDAGYINQILLSQDVFLKMMLTRYGGFGYSHILKNFVPRLKRLGVTSNHIYTLLVENPKRVFAGGEI